MSFSMCVQNKTFEKTISHDSAVIERQAKKEGWELIKEELTH